jgi:anaerobic magnesium-protoporphyrin IX monomethyl ester cyclase
MPARRRASTRVRDQGGETVRIILIHPNYRSGGAEIIGTTAVMPPIDQARGTLKIAKEVHPESLTVPGGTHATFIYQQVLTEAPWVDVIVRGEILLNLVRAIGEQRWTFAGSGLFTAHGTVPA